jgi:hypothetical protein
VNFREAGVVETEQKFGMRKWVDKRAKGKANERIFDSRSV